MRSREGERAGWNAKQTAEFQLQTARDDYRKLQTERASQPKVITRVTPSATTDGQPQVAAIRAIDALADKGRAIQRVWVQNNDDQVLTSGYAKWVLECESELKSLDDPSYAIQFQNARGSASMGCPDAHTVNGCGYWQDIEGKIQMLMTIITALRQHR